jgi:iron complex transport system permease protein
MHSGSTGGSASNANGGPPISAPTSATTSPRHQRQRWWWSVLLVTLLLLALGLAAGSEGLSWRAWQADWAGDQAALILGQIRAPRTVGALLVGALLGLSGAVAQGLFRNPLADPYLLGSAAGASLAVVLVLAAGSLAGHTISLVAAAWLERLGLVMAAFVGATLGVALTLLLARGAQHTVRLLLAGVVVGMLMGAATDLLALVSPEAMRGKQLFLLGSTGLLGWQSVGLMTAGLCAALPLAWRLARVLDALTLGEHSAASLGLALGRWRLVLVLVFAMATGLAVSQAGLVAFVGLVAPHLVRRHAPGPHSHLLLASAAAGGVLLLAADVVARVLIAPQELPVGVVTAVVGGVYLIWLLHRRARR